MYKQCSFDRKEYLAEADAFNDSDDFLCTQKELTEFSDNPEDLAHELAHTRFALAKAENEISRLKCYHFILKNDIADKDYMITVTNNKLDSIKKELEKRFKKKHSGYYLVFDEDGSGGFEKPMFIKADSLEEALIPEDCSYFRELVLAIPATSEFKD